MMMSGCIQGLSQRFARRAVFGMLHKLRDGHLTVRLPDGTAHAFGDPASEIRAEIHVLNERLLSRLIWQGNDGAGDAYVDGDWTSPDLVAVIRLAVRNLRRMEPSEASKSWFSRLTKRLRHKGRANTVRGAKENIAAHYDLSNEFFALFLDENMLYSSAVYPSAAATLEQAQVEKIDRLCRKLRLSPGDRVLEIGTGWGAFALHAARRYGCHVTTTTISREQHAHAAVLFAEAEDVNHRITLLDADYRALTGQFDKIVSIEMFEAVGLAYYDAFFTACDRLLAPGGLLAMQTITMNEQRFADYVRSSDWIQRRIFPGGELASVVEIQRSLARATQLGLCHMEDIGLHYAHTLAEWRGRFHASWPQAAQLGFDQRFQRLWDYYLGYCEGAFRERYISAAQLLLAKAGTRRALPGEPWDGDSTQDAVENEPLGQALSSSSVGPETPGRRQL